MIGTVNCVYETPCGWCSKWDKKCDKKIQERKPVRNNIRIDTAFTNATCQSESDHEWECCGISTAGTDYICKKCYARKTYPHEYNEQITTII